MWDGVGTAEMVRRDDPSSPGLAALRSEPALDRVAALAADLFDTPIALLLMFDEGHGRVAAQIGLDDAAVRQGFPGGPPLSDPVPRAVPDIGLDPLLLRHPVVAAARHARFYAGAPLLSADGTVLGVLCALDAAPRPPPLPRDMGRLEALAALARDAVEGHRALERAEAVAEAKTDLLADVSHELRTPLNGIVGFTQLLKRDGPLAESARLSVERIEEAGRGLLSIVEDALDLARLDTGAVRLDLRPFSAARLVEDAAALVRPEADRKGLALLVDISGASSDPLLGDPDRLRQVLLNLLSNAVKFTEAGTVRASLAVGAGPDTAVPVTFAVEDSGIGIPHDGIPRLFQRYGQADGSVARQFGGTGLGLAISKTLVEAMGGSIAVASSAGLGARFSVTLSLPRAIGPRPEKPAHHGDHPSADADGLKGLAILLAEDTPLNQKLVLQMLAPLGAEIDVVSDGAAAVDAVARRGYALVLMDMEMPVLGGLDATRRIRALAGEASAVPIVALTANAFPEHLDLCRTAGMDDHLIKPFSLDGLFAVVLHWARRAAPADEGGASHRGPVRPLRGDPVPLP